MATPAVNKVRDIDKVNTITVQADHMWKKVTSNPTNKDKNSHNIILCTKSFFFLKTEKQMSWMNKLTINEHVEQRKDQRGWKTHDVPLIC